MKSALLHFVILLATLSLIAPSQAQETMGAFSDGRGTTVRVDSESYYARIWDGKLFGPEGKLVERDLVPVEFDYIRDQVNEIEQAQAIHRNSTESIKRLNHLWLLINRPGSMPADERAKTLAMVARAKCSTYLQLHDHANAFVAASLMGLGQEPILLDGLKPNLIKYSKEDIVIMEKAYNAKGLSKLRDEAAKGIQDRVSHIREIGLNLTSYSYIAEHFGEPNPKTHSTVESHLHQGDMEAILQLGVRAVPALAASVLSDLEGVIHGFSIDPLIALLDVDELAASQLMVDYFETGGSEWKLRILNAFERIPDQGTLRSDEHRFGPNRIWPAIFEKLALYPPTQVRTLSHLNQGNRSIAITSSLASSLGAQIIGLNADRALAILRKIPSGVPYPNVKPLLDIAVEHQDDEVRMKAVEMYSRTISNRSFLLHLASDPSASVREALAKTFAQQPYYYKGSRGFTSRLEPTEQATQVLASLIQDQDAEVRAASLQSFMRWNHDYPTADIYIRALGQVQTREDCHDVIFRTRQLTLDERRRFIEQAAASDDPIILAGVDKWLTWANYSEEFEWYSSILLQRVHSEKVPIFSGINDERNTDERLKSLFHRFSSNNPIHKGFGIQFALIINQPELLTSSAWGMADVQNNYYSLPIIEPHFALRILQEAEPKARQAYSVAAENLIGNTGDFEEELALLVRDTSRPLIARIAALGVLMRKGNSQAERLALELFEINIRLSKRMDDYFFQNLYFRDKKRQQKFLRALLVEERPLTELTVYAASHFDKSENPEEFFSRILSEDALGHSKLHHILIRPTFTSIRQNNLHAQFIPEIIRASRYTSIPNFGALRCMDEHQNPVFIPALGALIRDENSDHEISFEEKKASIEVLEGFQNEAAAKELLKCLASATSEGIRQRIHEALASIRAYHEQKNYWENVGTAAPNLDGAVNELLAMLQDEDASVREAALLGLIPLGKSEVIPRVIPLLKDENANVRKAAKQVLDALQAARSDADGN
jgi:HEAT repeat protein